jgi:hypothetical protein
MKQQFKHIFSALIILSMIFLAFGSDETKDSKTVENTIKIDINNESEILNFIQGKWSWIDYSSGANSDIRYRFEINGNKITVLTCFGNLKDPFIANEKPEVLEFSIGKPTRDVDGHKCRYLEFSPFQNQSLLFRAISRGGIWVIVESDWDTPVIRGGGGGVVSWDKGWK